MHIVHVGASLRRATTNGVNLAATQYASYQSRAGHRVTMVSFGDDRSDVLDTATGVRALSLPYGRSQLSVPQSVRALFAQNRLEADIYHFHSAFIPRHNALARLIDTKYVVSPHGAYMPAALKRGRLRKAIYRRALDVGYLHNAYVVHALTSLERQAILEYATSCRVEVAPNPTAPQPALTDGERRKAREWLGLSDDEFCVVFIGRLDSEHKGLDLLVAGVEEASINPQGRPLRLCMAGPRVRARAFNSRVTRGASMPAWMQVMEPVFGREKRQILAAADCFASPSRWEGSPTAVLEALSLGIPVLVTRAAGIPVDLDGVPCGVECTASAADVRRGIRELCDQSWDRAAIRAAFWRVSNPASIVDRITRMYGPLE